MEWKDITVYQFQQLSKLWEARGERDDIEITLEVIGICYNLLDRQLEALTTQDMKTLSKGLDFLNVIPEWKAERFVTVGGNRYRYTYDIAQLRAARPIEVKSFTSQGFTEHLHSMAASMVVPQRKTWKGWVDAPYDAAKHSDYAKDLLQAPITMIHGSAVFFWTVFQNAIPLLSDYLTSTLPMGKREEAKRSLVDSCNIMGGSITLPLSQTTNESRSTKRMSFHTSNSSTGLHT